MLILYYRKYEQKKFVKSKSINLMKNLKCLYEAYIPKIIRNEKQLRYNLSEEKIFGNLNYSMSQEILKAKNIRLNYPNKNPAKYLMNYKPSKLLPIIRIKPS